MLEDAFNDDKMDRIIKKKADEASATRCASEIVQEALVRRALRGSEDEPDANSSDTDHFNDTCSIKSTPAKAKGTKRKNVFQQESERQDKRLRDDMELRRQQFEQQIQSQLKQHEDRMVLEREMQDRRMLMEQARALAQDQAEERMQRARQEAEERN
ncbi:hypothetical protein PC116_g16748 [Phytophthora cactorum]|nr:hypothetical protein PC114_g7224 [Phytophthora cactorum]KAG2952551.1 hypothetical protein PC117_g2700 [Phytophthora cactorum]KAG2982612.1 hypothetical protein PC120_g24611 [Phytophthora cactorum]KAG3137665.1 hypothetical protein PC128_g25708 [Phytophthora cactorum]KAG3155205.1 hypothetical protein C6341_g15515 [Phytophthora cactorum]